MTIGIGTYIDYKYTDKTIGEALKKNAASGGFGLVASAGTAVILGKALVSNSIGWSVAGGIVVGTGVSWTFNRAYDNNFLGIQDGLDWKGQFIKLGVKL